MMPPRDTSVGFPIVLVPSTHSTMSVPIGCRLVPDWFLIECRLSGDLCPYGMVLDCQLPMHGIGVICANACQCPADL